MTSMRSTAGHAVQQVGDQRAWPRCRGGWPPAPTRLPVPSRAGPVERHGVGLTTPPARSGASSSTISFRTGTSQRSRSTAVTRGARLCQGARFSDPRPAPFPPPGPRATPARRATRRARCWGRRRSSARAPGWARSGCPPRDAGRPRPGQRHRSRKRARPPPRSRPPPSATSTPFSRPRRPRPAAPRRASSASLGAARAPGKDESVSTREPVEWAESQRPRGRRRRS